MYLPRRNVCLNPFPFFNWVVFLLLSCESSLHTLDLCTSLVVCFNAQNLEILIKFIFSLLACAFGVLSKKPSPNPRAQTFTPMFSSKSCTV